jgi:hypothetical protein
MKKLFISLLAFASVFSFAPASLAATKAPVKTTAKKVAVAKPAPKKVATPAPRKAGFVASEAKKSTSEDGKKPPAGYMEILQKAQDKFLKARAAAKGNKAKLEVAEAAYNESLEEAQLLLTQE